VPQLQSTAAVLFQTSMNVLRRFDAPAEKMFELYGAVLGAFPDGVTNYFAETAQSREARSAAR